jgi:hypothetical protein
MDSAESGEGLGGRPHRAEERRDLVKDLQASAKSKVRLDALGASGKGGPAPSANAARSQDFLYDEFGLPEGKATSLPQISSPPCRKLERRTQLSRASVLPAKAPSWACV